MCALPLCHALLSEKGEGNAHIDSSAGWKHDMVHIVQIGVGDHRRVDRPRHFAAHQRGVRIVMHGIRDRRLRGNHDGEGSELRMVIGIDVVVMIAWALISFNA